MRPMHSTLELLLLTCFGALVVGFRMRARYASQPIAANQQHMLLVANRSSSTLGDFRFTLINNATIPLNILAMPKIMTLHVASENEVLPGDNFSFVPGMGVYDIHIVIHDGNNTWDNLGEATWGLTKDGVSYVVSAALGVGTSGGIALGVTAAVTTVLAPVLAPPILAPVAIATLWGTAIVSSMAVTALTGNAMNWVMDRMKVLDSKSINREIGDLDEMEGQAGRPADHPERLLLFTDVVTERPVVEAFRSSFPNIDVSRVVLTRTNAEAYLSAMMSEFKEGWKWSNGLHKKFLIQGGFTLPKPLVCLTTFTTWLKTEFEPLKLAEIKRTSEGLCHKSLVVRFQNAGSAWQQGWNEVRIKEGWAEVLVAEKAVPGAQENQQCKKQYLAMCESRSMRVVKVCARQLAGANETIWDTVDITYNSLFWLPRKISLNHRDSKLRVMMLDSPSSPIANLSTPSNQDDMQEVVCTWATPK